MMKLRIFFQKYENYINVILEIKIVETVET